PFVLAMTGRDPGIDEAADRIDAAVDRRQGADDFRIERRGRREVEIAHHDGGGGHGGRRALAPFAMMHSRPGTALVRRPRMQVEEAIALVVALVLLKDYDIGALHRRRYPRDVEAAILTEAVLGVVADQAHPAILHEDGIAKLPAARIQALRRMNSRTRGRISE